MNRFRSMTRSLLAVMIALSAASLTLVGALILSVANRSLQSFETYITREKYMETASAGSMFARDIDTLRNLMYGHLSNVNLLKMKLYLDDNTFNLKYLEGYQAIQPLIAEIETALDIAYGVSIYFPEYKRVITSVSATRYDGETEKWLDQLQQSDSNGPFLLDNQLIVMISSDVGFGAYGSSAIILSKIPNYVMARYLKQFAQEGSDAQFMLLVSGRDGPRLFAASRSPLSAEWNGRLEALVASGADGSSILENGGGRYLITWSGLTNSSLTICQITPMEPLDAQMQGYRAMIVLAYSLAMLVIILLIGLMYVLIQMPIRNMQRALRHVQSGDFSTRIAPTWSAEFQLVFDQFNRMTEHIQRLIRQEYELRLLNSKAELKQMQYQISPHFLYNTYFTLRAMLIDEEYDQAEQLAGIMGRYLRYITTATHDHATLREEVDHAVAYSQIQQIRFGNRIELRFEPCPDELLDLRVPKLILQPLIENAFEHGVKHQTGKGVIRVRFLCSDDALSILVEDNGDSTTKEMIERVRAVLESGASLAENDGVALANIHKRLSIVYPNDSGLRVSPSELGGFRSEIYIRGTGIHVQTADC